MLQHHGGLALENIELCGNLYSVDFGQILRKFLKAMKVSLNTAIFH